MAVAVAVKRIDYFSHRTAVPSFTSSLLPSTNQLMNTRKRLSFYCRREANSLTHSLSTTTTTTINARQGKMLVSSNVVIFKKTTSHQQNKIGLCLVNSITVAFF
jgi:hypothetical protein